MDGPRHGVRVPWSRRCARSEHRGEGLGLRYGAGWRVSGREAVRISFGFLGVARLVQAAPLGLDGGGAQAGGGRPTTAVCGCWRCFAWGRALAPRLARRSLAWSTLRWVWAPGRCPRLGWRWSRGVSLRSGKLPVREVWAVWGAGPACLRPPSDLPVARLGPQPSAQLSGLGLCGF
jgi:hypothetical protein